MDARIEWQTGKLWNVVADDGTDRILAFVHEGSDRPDDFSVRPHGSDPSLLADLRGRRYASVESVARAVADHLDGECRIR